MENIEAKSNNQNKNKLKLKIYEDQTIISDFVEPEWMKILKRLLEQRLDKNELVTNCNRLK